MSRRIDRWLVPYAASMTLLAAWFGCRMVVLRALLDRTRRFLIDRGAEASPSWSYHYSPEVLVERGWGYAFAVWFSEVGLPVVFVVVPVLFCVSWRRSLSGRRKIPTDLSLE